jgi:hypothetical protein
VLTSGHEDLNVSESTVSEPITHHWYARPVLFVSDLQDALRFYIDKLGFRKKWHAADGEGTVCQVDRGGCEIILCEDPARHDKGRLFEASFLLTTRTIVSVSAAALRKAQIGLTTPLKPKNKLSPSMTWAQFENGYWYATELKKFAEKLRLPSASKLRTDELEKAIKIFLQTGKIKASTARRLSTPGVKDTERGLSLEFPSWSTRTTWRRDIFSIAKPRLTYGQLVAEYGRLNQTK